MSSPHVLRRVITAQLHRVVVPMSLEYRAADPLAVTITLGDCTCRPLQWHVARKVIAQAVIFGGKLTDCAEESASSVLLVRPPGSALVSMGLRSQAGHWLVTVAAADLDHFVDATYVTCPLTREAQLVADELDLECVFFYLTQGGGNPA